MLKISTLWLMNKEVELLLAKRSLTKTFHPGEWGPTVTGTAEGDEDPKQTLLREVEEELGLKPGDYRPEFLLVKDYNHADGRVRRFSIYFAKVEKEITEKFKIDRKEVADLKWLSMTEIRQLLASDQKEFIIVPSARYVWSETFDILEKRI